MKKGFKFLAVLALSLSPFALAACQGGGNSEPSKTPSIPDPTSTTNPSVPDTPSIPDQPSVPDQPSTPVVEVVHVTGVELSSEKTTIKEGESVQLQVVVSPENATNKKVTYSSSDETVATVSKDGLVQGIKAGKVTITVTSEDGKKEDTLDLVVEEKPITEGTSYYFEGEEAKKASGSMGGIGVNSSDAGAKNGTSLANINCNEGATLTYQIEASEACKAGLYLNLAFGTQTVEHIFTLSVNDAEVAIPNVFQATGTANWTTYEEYFLANVSLLKGENTIVLTVRGACGNYDYMKLVSSETLSIVEEKPITEGTSYYFEGEDAARTPGQFGAISVNSEDAGARNNTSLGGINNNNGATLTYRIDAQEDCKAGVYLGLAFGGTPMSNIFTLKVNDETVNIPNTFDAIGTANWVTYADYFMANISLKKGMNVIVWTVTGGCGNYDYMKLISNEVLSLSVDQPITEGTSYYFEGEDAVRTPGSFGAIAVNTNDAGARNQTSLGGINENKGATLTYRVNAQEDCKAGVYLGLAFGGASASNIFNLTVNDAAVEIPSTFDAIGTANWATYADYFMANISLKQGTNVIVWTVTGGCGNYDYMKLITTGTLVQNSQVENISLMTSYELLKVGETTTISSSVLPSSATDKSLSWSSSDENIASIDENGVVTAKAEGSVLITATAKDGSGVSKSMRIFVSDKTGVRYEAENAELTNCQIEVNGTFVGGINNEGARVKFKVNSDQDQTVLLRICTSVVREGENSIGNFYKVELNGTEVDLANGTFASRGATGWNTPSGFYTVEVSLTSGENVIDLISVGTGVATTLDWIEIL